MGRRKESEPVVCIACSFALRIKIVASDNDGGGVRSTSSLCRDSTSMEPIKSEETCEISCGCLFDN